MSDQGTPQDVIVLLAVTGSLGYVAWYIYDLIMNYDWKGKQK